MKFTNKILPFFLIAILIFACSSPMDIDTPRKITILKSKRIIPIMDKLTIDVNGVPIYMKINEANAIIDTVNGEAYITMGLTLEQEAQNPSPDLNPTDNIQLLAMNINIDSLKADALPDTLKGRYPLYDSWAGFKLQRGLQFNSDTTVFAGEDRNVSEIKFKHDKEKKEVWAFLYSKIYDNKVWIEYKDTTFVNGFGLKVQYRFEIPHKAEDSLSVRVDFLLKY